MDYILTPFNFPEEIKINMFNYLDNIDISNFCRVNRDASKIDDACWRSLLPKGMIPPGILAKQFILKCTIASERDALKRIEAFVERGLKFKSNIFIASFIENNSCNYANPAIKISVYNCIPSENKRISTYIIRTNFFPKYCCEDVQGKNIGQNRVDILYFPTKSLPFYKDTFLRCNQLNSKLKTDNLDFLQTIVAEKAYLEKNLKEDDLILYQKVNHKPTDDYNKCVTRIEELMKKQTNENSDKKKWSKLFLIRTNKK